MAVSTDYFRTNSHPLPADRPHMADLLVEYLEQLGISEVFGVPGGGIEPFFDAMARASRRGSLRTIVARHESGAAFMADGYARESGKIGVVCSTTGPGATNLITGVASAMADGIPMLVITAQTALPNFGKRALQDSSCTAINTVGMFQHCTRYNSLVSHAAQLENKLIAAITETQGPPKGPVHLSIPMDVLRAPYKRSDAMPNADMLLRTHALLDTRALHKLCDYLGKAQRIVLFIGAGARCAIKPIMELAELVNATIVTTPAGKGLVNAFHPNYRGVFGFAGHESARQALEADNVDLVLVVGSSLDELDTGGWDRTALLNERLIHIDVTTEHFSRSPMAKLHVCGDLLSIFDTLSARVNEARRWGREWNGDDTNKVAHFPGPRSVKAHEALANLLPPNLIINDEPSCVSDSSPIKPQRVMMELAKRCPQETRFHVDAGNSWSWTTHYLHLKSTGNQRVGMGFGAMAWSLGAAIGSALANRNAPSVCITGDGSYLMSAHEITVAVAASLPVLFVVLNDQALGMVKHGQRLGGAEQVGFELPLVDFALMARAVGADGYRITSVEQLVEFDWEAVFSSNKPTLLDIVIDGEEIPPMGARMKTLKNKRDH